MKGKNKIKFPINAYRYSNLGKLLVTFLALFIPRFHNNGLKVELSDAKIPKTTLTIRYHDNSVCEANFENPHRGYRLRNVTSPEIKRTIRE